MKIQRILLVGLILVIVSSSCFQRSAVIDPLNSYRETKPLFGKTVTVEVCYDLTQKKYIPAAFDAIWGRLNGINWRMNADDTRSDVYSINNSYGLPVLVGDDTYKVLQEAMNMYYFSDHNFDITIRPFQELLKRTEQENKFPKDKEFEKLKSAVGMNYIKLLPNQYVEVLNPQTKIDLGGIAKGYAIDEAARILREYGFFNFYVDAGGDAYAGGHNCQNEPWRIEIRNPMNNREIVDIVEITDAAISTTDNYNNYYKYFYRIGDFEYSTKYSRIIPPDRGYRKIRQWHSLEGRMLISATIIAPVGIRADALATMSVILKSEKWKSLIDSWGEEYAGLRAFPTEETVGTRFVKTKWWDTYSVMQQPKP
jgi:FAD:protein FMN transferase